jgi:hypothetical protein
MMLACISNSLKTFFSCFITAASLIIIVAGLYLDCNASVLGGLYVEPFILIFCFWLLFMNEGFQVALIGIKTMSSDDLIITPNALRIHHLVFGGGVDRLPRLFLGQSFLVVLCTFLISQLTTFLTFPSLFHLPEWFMNIFFRSGLPGVVFTVNIVQLLPSIIAQEFAVTFLDRVPMLHSVIRLALAIESIGILQTTYLIVNLLERIYFGSPSSQPILSVPTNDQRTLLGSTEKRSLLHIAKAVFSLVLFLFCLAFVLYSIAIGYSNLRASPSILFALLFVAYLVVFYAEGCVYTVYAYI